MTHLLASSAFPAPEHDHGHCLAEAMDRARKAFEDKGLKLTGLRRSVFGEIAASHKAIGASGNEPSAWKIASLESFQP